GLGPPASSVARHPRRRAHLCVFGPVGLLHRLHVWRNEVVDERPHPSSSPNPAPGGLEHLRSTVAACMVSRMGARRLAARIATAPLSCGHDLRRVLRTATV